MTLEEALNSNDMSEIIDSMTAYAYSRIKTIGIKDLEGKEPEDFVGEVLMKVAEGERDWSKAKCTFKEFLFGCLKSHLSNFYSSHKQIYENELPDLKVSELKTTETSLKDIAIQILKEDGADKDEISIFECWIDGIKKPSIIAEQLTLDVKVIYNITKRLERRIPKLKSQITNFV